MGAQLLRVGGLHRGERMPNPSCHQQQGRPQQPLPQGRGAGRDRHPQPRAATEPLQPQTPLGGPAWCCPPPGPPCCVLTKLPSSSTLTAKSLSLSPSAVNTPTASGCSPNLSAGMETGSDPGWAWWCPLGETPRRWHPLTIPLTSGRIHLHQDVLPVPAEPGGEGPQDIPHRGVDGQHRDQARVVGSVDLVGHYGAGGRGALASLVTGEGTVPAVRGCTFVLGSQGRAAGQNRLLLAREPVRRAPSLRSRWERVGRVPPHRPPLLPPQGDPARHPLGPPLPWAGEKRCRLRSPGCGERVKAMLEPCSLGQTEPGPAAPQDPGHHQDPPASWTMSQRCLTPPPRWGQGGLRAASVPPAVAIIPLLAESSAPWKVHPRHEGWRTQGRGCHQQHWGTEPSSVSDGDIPPPWGTHARGRRRSCPCSWTSPPSRGSWLARSARFCGRKVPSDQHGVGAASTPPGTPPGPSPRSRYLQQSRGAAVALQQPPVEQHPLAHQPQNLPALVQGVGGFLLLRALQRLRAETGTSQGHQHGWWGAGRDPLTRQPRRTGWEMGNTPCAHEPGGFGAPLANPRGPTG